MTKISLPAYDECRTWIRGAREKGIDWKKIGYGLKDNDLGLNEFLEAQKTMNFWPQDLNDQLWWTIVSTEKDAEEKSKRISIMDDKAVLVDSSQDSEVTIPQDLHSSWQLYKAHLLDSGFKEESVIEIEDATVKLLKRLNNNTKETGPVKGLVIGHVQSGKTANMAALMAMAADWGWNFFVVLSGTIENLRKQTQSRLFNDLNKPGNINWSGLEHLSKKSALGQRAQDLHFEDGSNMRYFNVCLKNSARLKHLIEWMQQDPNKHRQMKVIVIDDEADQASINTADIKKTERAKINSLIVNLVEGNKPKGEKCKSQVRAMNYISYTATPYANFLNESGRESLYPSNFIRTLKTSNEYFGPKQIFGIEESENCDGLNIVRTISENDFELLKKLHNEEIFSIPDSLKDAICWFICAASSMRYFNYKKPVSMLIHTSQKQQHHKQVADSVRNWISSIDLNNLMLKCEEIWNRETKAFTLDSLREVYPDYGCPDENINKYPEFDELKNYIKELVKDITNIPLGEDGELKYRSHIHLCIDNCANNGVNDEGMFVRLAYPDKSINIHAPAFIVIGGSTLSRGLTIEGLISTYFLRSTCQADSLMQMGRWFGYRKGYELLPRIWMTDDTQRKFKFLSVLESELREELYKYMVAGRDPSEFGPRVKNTPDISWLRITSKNKMQNAKEIEMDFTGTSNQTILFDNDKEILLDNISITEEFLNSLGTGELSFIQSAYVWRGIQFGQILKGFLEKFKFQKRSRVFNQIDAFAEWMLKVSKQESFTDWNVILAGSGDSIEKRKHGTWEVNQTTVGKVNRSRKNNSGYDQDIINIGVLRAPKDLMADVNIDILSEETRKTVNAGKIDSLSIDRIRNEAGLERTPQLIIYRIDKDSTARENSKTRMDLNAKEDIIGICINIPGSNPAKNNAGALTVKINKGNMKASDEWGDEE